MSAWLDNIIETISPSWGLKRRFAREALSTRGYDAGKLNRVTQGWKPISEPGDPVNWEEVTRLRDRSWDLYRNNPQARKLVNSICSKVLPLHPQPQSVDITGKTADKFREESVKHWQNWLKYASASGTPGMGGWHGTELFRIALRMLICSGEVLIHKRYLTRAEMIRRGSPAPLVLELVSAERMADAMFPENAVGSGNQIFRGVEVTPEGYRAAYWLYDEHVNTPYPLTSDLTPKRYPAEDFIHLYMADQYGQYRGVPWLSAVMMPIRNIDDLDENELLASVLRSCVIGGIRRINQAAAGGFAGPANSNDTDGYGNSFRRFQPGSIMELREGEDMIANNMGGPNINVPEFGDAMTRKVATGMPGVKSSTLTGDYRNASFSSEKAADNDNWPEVFAIQKMIANHFLQPVWEQLTDDAVVTGTIEEPGDYQVDPDMYLACNWQGPVPKSINPKDDAEADILSMRNGFESLQSIASRRGSNWREVLNDMAEVYEYAGQKSLNESFINTLYGVMPEPSATNDGNQQQSPDGNATQKQEVASGQETAN